MMRRALDFRSFDEVIADLERLQRGYTKTGNWDLGQACHHLAIFVRGSMDGFTGKRPPWFARLLAPLFVRWMLKKRRMPAGVKTPDHMRPPATTNEESEVQVLKELLRRFQSHTAPLHQSPFAGDMSYDTWREMHLIHCSHHLSFLHPNEAAS